MITNALRLPDGTVCYNLRYSTGWRRSLGWNEELYVLRAGSGTPQLVNSRYPDYGVMDIIGQANGKLYLKCEMGIPGEEGLTLWNTDGRNVISPYNDGYFTLEVTSGGVELTRIARYLYTDGDFVTPGGAVYGLINWRDEVRKIA